MVVEMEHLALATTLGGHLPFSTPCGVCFCVQNTWTPMRGWAIPMRVNSCKEAPVSQNGHPTKQYSTASYRAESRAFQGTGGGRRLGVLG